MISEQEKLLSHFPTKHISMDSKAYAKKDNYLIQRKKEEATTFKVEQYEQSLRKLAPESNF